jgi:hypothetical protein
VAVPGTLLLVHAAHEDAAAPFANTVTAFKYAE